MALPESFKFDVRVRERLLRNGQISESEIEKHLEGLSDASANASNIELKQPAFQTEAERAENAVVVRSVPARPIALAAPINLDEEDEDDDEEIELPKPRASQAPAASAATASVAATPAASAPAPSRSEDEDEEDDEDDEDDEDESDDEDEDEDEDEESDEDEDEDEGGSDDTSKDAS